MVLLAASEWRYLQLGELNKIDGIDGTKLLSTIGEYAVEVVGMTAISSAIFDFSSSISLSFLAMRTVYNKKQLRN